MINELFKIIKDNLPNNSVLVCNNIYNDLPLLYQFGLKPGIDFKTTIDAREVWCYNNASKYNFNNYTVSQMLYHMIKMEIASEPCSKKNAIAAMNLFQCYIIARRHNTRKLMQVRERMNEIPIM